MIQPVRLPSGKVVDISKCIAIIPATQLTSNEVILSGTDCQIEIDSLDLETLQMEIERNQQQDKYRFEPNRNSPEAEEKYRQDLASKLKAFNLQWERLASDEKASQESAAFKQILDAERPIGQKLYSAE